MFKAPTIEEIYAMNEQQLRELNARLARKVLKKFIIQTGVALVTSLAVVAIVNKIDDKTPEQND